MYEDRVVLFLDILGFEDLIKKSVEDNLIYRNILDALSKIKGFENKYGQIQQREVTAFSDSIIISYPNDKRSLVSIFFEIKELILILLGYNIICRGGVGFGELYHKESIVFGPALITAYKLESESAILPRVIINEKDIFEYKDLHLEMFLEKDKDGFIYFDIFKFFYGEDGKMMYTSIFIKDKMNEIIQNNIHHSKDCVREKYLWLSEKFHDGLRKKITFELDKE